MTSNHLRYLVEHYSKILIFTFRRDVGARGSDVNRMKCSGTMKDGKVLCCGSVLRPQLSRLLQS